MRNYLDLMEKIMAKGIDETNRTGIKRRSLFNQHLEFDLAEGFPILTTKKVLFKSVVAELLWFLSGSSNTKDMDCKIWDSWADTEGNVETAYGRYWRNFPVVGGEFNSRDGEVTQDGMYDSYNGDTYGIDQIQYLRDSLKALKKDLSHKSRTRLVCVAWHPDNAIASKLPPCHYTFVLNVQGDKLNLHWTQRSCDVPVGLPFNISSYALLLHLFAHDAGFTPGKLGCTLVDAHVYHNQFEGVNKQLLRNTRALPGLRFIHGGDCFQLASSDSVALTGYDPDKFIKYEVAV